MGEGSYRAEVERTNIGITIEPGTLFHHRRGGMYPDDEMEKLQ